jgi:heavy metal sensor kinase
MINSVRIRLTLWYVVAFGILLAGFSGFVYMVLSQTMYSRFDRSLLDAALVVTGEFKSELEENSGNVTEATNQTLSELRIPETSIAIFDDTRLLGTNLDHEPRSTSELVPDASLEHFPAFGTVKRNDPEGLRVAVVSARIGDKEYFIGVLQPLSDLAQQLRSIRRIFYIGFPVSLFVAGIGGFILAKKSFAPVVAMCNQAERIGANNLHERLSVKNDDELGQLAYVFNDLLSRLDDSFDGMRKFTADASHELRTPLSIIRGEADVALSQNRDPSEYREALSIIQDEATRLSRIVDDMMALARSDAGQRPMHIEEFYLNDLVEECCKAATVLTVRKGVSLNIEPSSDITFRGDEDLLRRMLLNLLDNAIKYTPTGGSVSVELITEPGDVKLIVSDTGVGIPAVDVPHVFERFYRVDKARSRADGGTGLGLSIAKWVVEAHKGSIELTSTPGRGSRFIVTLPADAV